MKSNFLKGLLPVLLLAFSLSFVSCGDDKNDNPSPQDLATKVESSWILKKFSVDAMGETTDYLSEADSTGTPNCLATMVSTFKSGGKIDVTAENGCDADDNIVSPTDTWEVVGNKIRLKDEDGLTKEFDLVVDDKEMKWSLEAEALGVNMKTNIVFIKK